MQTFLPYPSFVESAKVLDNKRLGKQRVEAYQILRVLEGKSKGWQNHPVVLMWRGYETLLSYYGYRVCQEWMDRGFKDTLQPKFEEYSRNHPETSAWPNWLRNEKFHTSHRSNLLRKDPKHYGQFGWIEKNDLPYYWPTKEGI